MFNIPLYREYNLSLCVKERYISCICGVNKHKWVVFSKEYGLYMLSVVDFSFADTLSVHRHKYIALAFNKNELNATAIYFIYFTANSKKITF